MSHDVDHVPESNGGIVYYHIPHNYRISESVVLQKIMFESYYEMSEKCQTLYVYFHHIKPSHLCTIVNKCGKPGSTRRDSNRGRAPNVSMNNHNFYYELPTGQ